MFPGMGLSLWILMTWIWSLMKRTPDPMDIILAPFHWYKMPETRLTPSMMILRKLVNSWLIKKPLGIKGIVSGETIDSVRVQLFGCLLIITLYEVNFFLTFIHL